MNNILCIDLGGGTQDICYYTGQDTFENSVKLVLPTPSKHICAAIKAMQEDLFIGGGVIGGGALSGVIREKIAAGFNVYMARSAFASVRDNEEYVRKLGVSITEDVINPNVILNEFDYDLVAPLISGVLGDCSPDIVAVAAQDHGYVPGQSDRVTRFAFLKDFLKNGLRNAFFTEKTYIPENFTRWRSLADEIKRKCPKSALHISDTAVVAALGATSITDKRPVITIDAGNCHTFAALLGENDSVCAFFEHHTAALTPAIARSLTSKLASCTITGDEIFENSGHGAYVFEKIDASGCPVLVTGPNRERLFTPSGNIIFSHPKGDTMMAGPIGLLIQSGVVI